MTKGYLYSNQGSLWGSRDVVGFGVTDFYIKEIEKDISKKMIIKNHYSHKVCNDATTHVHLGVFVKGSLMGVLQFGYAMNPRSAGSVVAGTPLNGYKELNRMWIDDAAGKYPESRAVAFSIKYIKEKHPAVKWIQSFADERCGGLGIVYQACSFDYYGSHKSIFWEFENEIYHNSIITNNSRSRKAWLEARGFHDKATRQEIRQFRYIKWVDKRAKKDCLLKQLPYPKHYKGGF